TPHLEKLAASGMTFTQWYSTFHVCSPSRASMMTGRYSVRSGIGIAPGVRALSSSIYPAQAVGGLPLNETTMAEALKEAGYATAAIGKWHLGQREIFLPTNQGFDEYLGIPFSQDMGLSFWFLNNLQPVEPYQPVPLPLLDGTDVIEQPVALSNLVHRYIERATDFIKRSHESDTPFFLYLPFNHVHAPNSCSPKFCGSSEQGAVGDAVQEMDWAIGRIMSYLEKLGLENDTLTFFTSDNGAPLLQDGAGNGVLRDGKASMWEGGFKVPALAHWPGMIKGNQVSHELTSTADIYPTLMHFAGVPLPSDRVYDGIDLSDVLLGKEGAKGHECIMFYHNAVAANASGELYAVRCGDMKVYWATASTTSQPWADGPQEPPLVFNLTADPGETTPLTAWTEEYGATLGVLTAAKEAHLATITPVPDQNALGSLPTYTICGEPNSQTVFARFPACTTTPQNWHPIDVCNSQVCLEANVQFAANCDKTMPALELARNLTAPASS
ncbi:uncharacterized protein MONBRDRAFT_13963, partial [Monosiga brevicollis MX1]